MVQPPPLGTADDEERKTRQGAVVWAKVTGFPWWPAYIAEASVVQKSKRKRDTDYWVQFFNDNQGAWLAPSAIRLMTDEMTAHFQPLVKPGNKHFTDFSVALKLAQSTLPAPASARRDTGGGGDGARAGRDAAGAAGSGGRGGTAAAPSPSSGSGSRGKAHAKKWGSLAAPHRSPSPPAGRFRRASPPAAGAAGGCAAAHGTPVTPPAPSPPKWPRPRTSLRLQTSSKSGLPSAPSATPPTRRSRRPSAGCCR